jgi:serine/threonine protein kinase
MIKNEIELLLKIDHPYIINVFEIYVDDHHYHIITPYCEGGELFTNIINNGGI